MAQGFFKRSKSTAVVPSAVTTTSTSETKASSESDQHTGRASHTARSEPNTTSRMASARSVVDDVISKVWFMLLYRRFSSVSFEKSFESCVVVVTIAWSQNDTSICKHFYSDEYFLKTVDLNSDWIQEQQVCVMKHHCCCCVHVGSGLAFRSLQAQLKLWIALLTRRVLLHDESASRKAPSPEPGELFTNATGDGTIVKDGEIAFEADPEFADDDGNNVDSGRPAAVVSGSTVKPHLNASSKRQQQQQGLATKRSLKRIGTAVAAINSMTGA